MKVDLKKIPWKKIVKVGACLMTGVVAFSQAVGEQKREEEFEEMKQTLSELKGKES